MRSIKFPEIFTGNATAVWKSKEQLEATKQNAKLLLNTERGELYGDPYFGLMLKHYLFNQNNYVLKDSLIEIIYTQLRLFLPQVYVERKNIDIIQNKQKGLVEVKFSGINQIDYQLNTFNLVMYQDKDATL